jgi:acetoin utilization deacetylase AcuC-like enzyme
LINIFYNEEQSIYVHSTSPSPGKPQRVVAEWQRLFPDNINIIPFAPVAKEQLYTVHDRAYVDGVLAGTRNNGFGTKDVAVAQSLLHTSGSMLSAAQDALLTKTVAVSPTSGFHHACYANGGGFCTFNGLALTAYELHLHGLAKKVGILDCDYHYGNGTDNIIKHCDLDFFITHITAGAHYGIRAQAQEFMDELPAMLKSLNGCDIILYQAGADPHINDPLGGFLTSEQMRERDRLVFSFCSSRKIPVAWNLAGGYQEPLQKVLDLHNATMEECVKAYENKA